MIRGFHDDGIGTLVGHRSPNTIERSIDFGMQPVVQVAVLLRSFGIGAHDGTNRSVTRRVSVTEGDLCRGFGCQILVLGRRLGHVRWGERRRFEWAATASPRRKKHDVVRVHEACDQQKWSQRVGVSDGSFCITILEPRHHAIGDQRIATHPGIA